MHWADAWIKEAASAASQPHPNAMTVVTVSDDAQPSARIVLCKDFVPDPGYLVFYTNYGSRKMRELDSNSSVAVLFHWDQLGRQIRLEGLACRSPDKESDEYFAARDWGSRLGAWGSDQSETIATRADLIAQIRARAGSLGIALGEDTETLVAGNAPPPIPRPPHWGGVRVWPTMIELWVAGADRIHDRAVWKRDIVRISEHKFSTSPWQGTRLQP